MEVRLEFITKILDFLLALTTIATAVLSKIKPEYSQIYIAILIVLIIILIIIIIINYQKTKTLRKKVGFLNREIALCERNLYYAMKNSYKRDDDISTINEIMINKLKEYVNLVSEILSLYIKKQVTVSIRIFENIKYPIDNSILRVLAFSKNCDKDREEVFRNNETSPKKVSENTDFKYIIGENIENKLDYIYETNLKEFNDRLSQGNGKGYENKTPNREKYYKGRIVIPIYMENNILFFIKENTGRDIKGFLCADVKEKNILPTNEKKKYFLIYLLESYASKLYIILNKYNYYLDNIMKGVKHDKKFHRITKEKNTKNNKNN